MGEVHRRPTHVPPPGVSTDPFDGLSNRLARLAAGPDRSQSEGENGALLTSLVGDERLAFIFKQMRSIVGVGEPEMARLIGTNLSIVLDLEAGLVDGLPAWPEAARIVEAYAALAKVDPSPVLSHLMRLQSPHPGMRYAPAISPPVPAGQAQLQSPLRRMPPPAAIAAPAPVQPLPVPRQPAVNVPPMHRVAVAPPVAHADPAAMPDSAVGFTGRSKLRNASTGDRTGQPPADVTAAADQAGTARAEAAGRKARRRRRLRSTALVATPIVLVLVTLVMAHVAPRSVYAMAGAVPRPVGAPLRAIVDFATLQAAPVRDGLRWIDIGDPRVRKSDRLTGR